tara:strand:- start:1880 stop:2047 length:168 start_codon:yes stop_codon:yes gene_type:complete
MLGFTRLTPEEKAELDKKKRIEELHTLLHKETKVRQESLTKSEGLRDELENLLKG